MQTVLVKYCDIPLYLQAGERYRSLRPTHTQSEIEVPADCLQNGFTTCVNGDAFTEQLRIASYWMLDVFPPSVVSYCKSNEIALWKDDFKLLPPALKLKLLSQLFGRDVSQRDVSSQPACMLVSTVAHDFEAVPQSTLRISPTTPAPSAQAATPPLQFEVPELVDDIHRQLMQQPWLFPEYLLLRRHANINHFPVRLVLVELLIALFVFASMIYFSF